jgi:UDP-glucose 4-epimerase
VYNIGGDETCSVGDALDTLISKSSKPFTKVLDQKRVRPTDITLQIPDSSKFRNHFNWKPKRTLNDICNDLLNYWRNIV